MDLENFRIATRQTSKTARGRERIIGKGKRASSDGSKDCETTEESDVKGKVAKEYNASQSRKRKKEKLEETESGGLQLIAPGVVDLFNKQRRGNKGIREMRSKNAAKGSLFPTGAQLEFFQDRVLNMNIDPLSRARKDLETGRVDFDGKNWTLLLQQGWNLLFYGIGCKVSLIDSFAKKWLDGEDVLVIHGDCKLASSSSRLTGLLLDCISTKILKIAPDKITAFSQEIRARIICDKLNKYYSRASVRQYISEPMQYGGITPGAYAGNDVAKKHEPPSSKDCDEKTDNALSTSSSTTSLTSYFPLPIPMKRTVSLVQGNGSFSASGLPTWADPKWGGRYMHAKSRLYIVVHELDGESLRHPECQRILATLASCASVSIIASINSLNAPLLWPLHLLGKLNFAFHHVPTFKNVDLGTFSHSSSRKRHQGPRQSIDIILASVTHRHREIFQVVCRLVKETLAQEGKKNSGADSSLASSSTSSARSSTERIVVPMRVLLGECRKNLMVKSQVELNTMLKELNDHEVLLLSSDEQSVFVNVAMEIIEQFSR